MSDLKLIAQHVRRDLLLHQLDLRELLLMELFLQVSFDDGRPSVKVPSLPHLERCIGVSKGNIHSILATLVKDLILSCERGEVDTYRILPRGRDHEWKRSTRAMDRDANVRLLRAFQLTSEDQAELIPRDKSLVEAIAEAALESESVPESGTRSRIGNENRSRIGNAPPPANIRYTSNVVRPERNVGGDTFAARDVGTPNALSRERALRARVLAFVGEADYQKYWARPKEDHVFTDDHVAAALDRALRDAVAQIADGVRVIKTRGALLYDSLKRERERAVA